jgi:methylated-DNA-[protein]-cysteine S-methyltransferase
MEPLACRVIPSAFGKVGIVWHETANGPRVRRILLPNEIIRVEGLVRTKLVDLAPLPRLSCPAVEELARPLERFLGGDTVDFDLAIIALKDCSRFQRRVLLAEYNIPRGCVSTYGRIARRLGVVGGARAVGTALARNPFPIIIPCHRAVRSDGALGGFRGGLKMKRALLEMEGRKFSRAGKVVMTKIYY